MRLTAVEIVFCSIKDFPSKVNQLQLIWLKRSAFNDNIQTYVNIPGFHLVDISMVFINNDSTLSVFPTRWSDINHGLISINKSQSICLQIPWTCSPDSSLLQCPMINVLIRQVASRYMPTLCLCKQSFSAVFSNQLFEKLPGKPIRDLAKSDDFVILIFDICPLKY